MGSSKKQNAGHRYLFGLHMGLSRGPLDELVEIQVGDREAWKGSITKTGRIFINKPDLFGGDKGQGGSGTDWYVQLGSPTTTCRGGFLTF
ncbi:MULTISPECIES: hypothetical protein [Lysobacter]|uniref:hypothetical protein n=1 Tax=Lysobacter TaxID=68 RepID=UPI001F3EF2DF|nr:MULTISPECIES: hypothetical protein [Lysobacter]UJB18764.1 hypothetical protein L1A79_20980 [Lysobacter capsici]UJQ27511.1 hypothetical protein L2D09_18905 [Lysobacter gummosus]